MCRHTHRVETSFEPARFSRAISVPIRTPTSIVSLLFNVCLCLVAIIIPDKTESYLVARDSQVLMRNDVVTSVTNE